MLVPSLVTRSPLLSKDPSFVDIVYLAVGLNVAFLTSLPAVLNNLIVPGTSVPNGVGPEVGSTKRPLEF